MKQINAIFLTLLAAFILITASSFFNSNATTQPTLTKRYAASPKHNPLTVDDLDWRAQFMETLRKRKNSEASGPLRHNQNLSPEDQEQLFYMVTHYINEQIHLEENPLRNQHSNASRNRLKKQLLARLDEIIDQELNAGYASAY